MILACDPGKYDQSFTLFLNGGVKFIRSYGPRDISGKSIRKDAKTRVDFYPVKNPTEMDLGWVTHYRLWSRKFAADCKLNDGPHWLVVEKPDHVKFPSNEQVRNLCDLSVSVGVLAATFHARGWEVRLAEPREWKGNQSKEKMRDNIVGPYLDGQPDEVPRLHEIDDDESDSVALGLWWMERLRKQGLGDPTALCYHVHEKAVLDERGRRRKKRRTTSARVKRRQVPRKPKK